MEFTRRGRINAREQEFRKAPFLQLPLVGASKHDTVKIVPPSYLATGNEGCFDGDPTVSSRCAGAGTAGNLVHGHGLKPRSEHSLIWLRGSVTIQPQFIG